MRLATVASPTPGRPRIIRGWLLAALIAGLPSVVTAEDQQPVITSVSVVAIGDVVEEQILEVLELEPGSRLDPARLREVITSLFAGGEVEWLRVDSRSSEDGVDLRVRLSLRSTISDIRIRARNPFLLVRVARWLQLERGDPVTAAGVEAARRRVERRLQDRGFAEAIVEASIDYDRATNSVKVEFVVRPGAAHRLAEVEIESADEALDPQLTPPKHPTGRRLTVRLEDRLRERTETDLRQMGFWEAEVLDVERRGTGSDVTLVLRVETGALYRLELEAPEDRREVAADAVPDPAGEELHPEQTEALSEQVHERLQEDGYLLADVRAELHGEGGERVLSLVVDPGDRLKIGAVEFPGAHHFSPSRLRDEVRVAPGGTGGRFGQRVSNSTLEDDRQAVEAAYHRAGFPFVSVGRPEVEIIEGLPEVRVAFPVEEGARWLMEEVRVDNLPVESQGDLDTRPLELAPGAPWSPAAVEQAQHRLEEALRDTGYPEGRVAVEVDTSNEGRAVAVFDVDPGPFVRVGEVIIAGLRRTEESLVRGVVRRAGVSRGEPLSRRRLLEAQRGLFELGLFRRVELVPMPGQERRLERNIVVRIEEGDQRSYLFGVGYSDRDAARVILGWSHLNLLGRGYAFAAEVSLSQAQQRYSLSLRKKRLLGLPMPGYLVVYRTDEEIGDRDLVRRGLWIDFGDRLKRPLRPWLRYEYEIIDNDAPIPSPDPFASGELQESRVASITPSVEWDTRDNPLAPTRGVFASASLQYAFPAFQADSHFLKFQAGGTVYSPVGGGFGAAGLRLGAITPLDGIGSVPENLQIPFAYRLFAGGRTTHRAFDTDTLGIPGQTLINGSPVGGNALLLLNLEYRHRMIGQFFIAGFVDAGNVWASASNVELGDIRVGAGLGLQYMTPAGALRAEYGWKLDRQPGEDSGQLFISFGVPF